MNCRHQNVELWCITRGVSFGIDIILLSSLKVSTHTCSFLILQIASQQRMLINASSNKHSTINEILGTYGLCSRWWDSVELATAWRRVVPR